MTHTKKLEVRCYGELVGYLAETPDHMIAFQYADAWIRNGFSKLVRMLTKDNASDKEQLYRVMCFNCFTHNRDDHTKNFSFLYTNDHGWRLAPAYDLTYSDTYWGEQTTSVNGKGSNISDKDFIKTGREAGLSKDFCENSLKEIKEKTAVLEPYLEAKNLQKVGKIPPADRITEINKQN